MILLENIFISGPFATCTHQIMNTQTNPSSMGIWFSKSESLKMSQSRRLLFFVNWILCIVTYTVTIQYFSGQLILNKSSSTDLRVKKMLGQFYNSISSSWELRISSSTNIVTSNINTKSWIALAVEPIFSALDLQFSFRDSLTKQWCMLWVSELLFC